MALLELQKVLLRLYTNQTALNAFLDNPDYTLKEYDLDKRERSVLLQIPRKRLRDFNHELFHKKMMMLNLFLKKAKYAAIISPFYKSSPALFIKKYGKTDVLELTEGEFDILHFFAKLFPQTALRLFPLFKAFIRSPKASLYDFYHLIVFFSNKKMWGCNFKKS